MIAIVFFKKIEKSVKKYGFSALCRLISGTNDAQREQTFLGCYRRISIFKDSGTEIVDDSLVTEKSAAAELLSLAVADRVARELFCFFLGSRAAELPHCQLVGVKSNVTVLAGQRDFGADAGVRACSAPWP